MSSLASRAAERLRAYGRGVTPRRLRARLDGPRVLANSVPKSGTNLLLECLSLFPNLRPSFAHVEMNANRRPGTAELERGVRKTGRGQYTSAHVFHDEANARIVREADLRMVLIVRDPRDVVTSHFHYVTEKNTTHRLTDHYQALPDDNARLMASIRGVDGENTRDSDPLESIGEWMDAFLGWGETPYTTVVRFEDLIGPRGGGDRDVQRETVRTIADHLDTDLREERVEYVAQNTFSTGSSTFRKGLIGDWRNHFEPEHVAAFKEEAGDWLVDLGYEDDTDWDVEGADGVAAGPGEAAATGHGTTEDVAPDQ